MSDEEKGLASRQSNVSTRTETDGLESCHSFPAVETYMGISLAFKGLERCKQAMKTYYSAYTIASHVAGQDMLGMCNRISSTFKRCFNNDLPAEMIYHLLITLVNSLYSLADEASTTMHDDLLSYKSKI